jgi:hypothetical protein
MSKTSTLGNLLLAVVCLASATLACGPPSEGDASDSPQVAIASPLDGTRVEVGQDVQVHSMASADAGVHSVELRINGQTLGSDEPPAGNPTSFSVIQTWTPVAEGNVVVSVVAHDVDGETSDPATIQLEVTGPASSGADDRPDDDGCRPDAAYVADVTMPDNTTVDPGATFVKTWRIRNSGTCQWRDRYALAYVKGDRMDSEATIAVNDTAPGETVEVSVPLTAPSSPGTYRGEWRMRSEKGAAFGPFLSTQIVVPGAGPEPTQDPAPQTICGSNFSASSAARVPALTCPTRPNPWMG